MAEHPEWRVLRMEKKYQPGKQSTHDNFFAAYGRYYIRCVKDGAVSFELQEINDPSRPMLVSVRTIAVSPFPADQAKVPYFGGYDCNFQPSRNTRWIYRGTIKE